MIAEALEFLQEESAGRVNTTIKQVTAPDLAPGKVALLMLDENNPDCWTFKEFDYSQAPQKVVAKSPDVLSEYVGEDPATIFIDEDNCQITAFLVEPNAAVLFANMESVSCKFKPTKQWAMIQKGFDGTPEEIVRLQKLSFANQQDDIVTAQSTIEKFCRKFLANVKMSVTKSATTVQQNGGDSMGLDVTRQALGGDGTSSERNPWPDYVSFTTRVLEDIECAQTVPMLVSFVPEKNRIRFDPVEEYVQEAELNALEFVKKLLGRPNRLIILGNVVVNAGKATIA